MKFKIAHTSRGRVRIQVIQKFMTLEQADLLEAYLQTYPKVCQVSVHERTRCAIIRYHGSLDELLPFLRRFSCTAPEVLTFPPHWPASIPYCGPFPIWSEAFAVFSAESFR